MSFAGKAMSVRARLLSGARERKEDFSLTLSRYATERLLFRMSISPHREHFVLKGAMLFDLWFDEPHRPTRDADFLGFGPMDAEGLRAVIGDVCLVKADDGMTYDPTTIRIAEIREEANYGGLRVTLRGRLGAADSAVQLDVGYGDAVVPGPIEAELPRLLDDQPPVRLRVYPRESVVSEKLEAIVKLGMINSRLKDYFDLHALRLEKATNDDLLVRAITSTFERRRSDIPRDRPVGLSAEFSGDKAKRAQWSAFLRKNRLESPPLEEVVDGLAGWLVPLLGKANSRGAAARSAPGMKRRSKA